MSEMVFNKDMITPEILKQLEENLPPDIDLIKQELIAMGHKDLFDRVKTSNEQFYAAYYELLKDIS